MTSNSKMFPFFFQNFLPHAYSRPGGVCLSRVPPQRPIRQDGMVQVKRRQQNRGNVKKRKSEISDSVSLLVQPNASHMQMSEEGNKRKQGVMKEQIRRRRNAATAGPVINPATPTPRRRNAFSTAKLKDTPHAQASFLRLLSVRYMLLSRAPVTVLDVSSTGHSAARKSLCMLVECPTIYVYHESRRGL